MKTDFYFKKIKSPSGVGKFNSVFRNHVITGSINALDTRRAGLRGKGCWARWLPEEIMPERSPGVPRGVSWMLGHVTDETCISEDSLEEQNG